MVIDDDYVLPFSEVIDWTRASVRVWLSLWSQGMQGIRELPEKKVFEMREQVNGTRNTSDYKGWPIDHFPAWLCVLLVTMGDAVLFFLQVLFLYHHYFFSMATIVNTVLDIINERVFPNAVQSYEVYHDLREVYNHTSHIFTCFCIQHWNNPPYNPTQTNRMQVSLKYCVLQVLKYSLNNILLENYLFNIRSSNLQASTKTVSNSFKILKLKVSTEIRFSIHDCSF